MAGCRSFDNVVLALSRRYVTPDRVYSAASPPSFTFSLVFLALIKAAYRDVCQLYFRGGFFAQY